MIFALIALVATLALSSGYFLFLRKSYAPLYTKLRTADAAAAVAELDKAKIPYQLTDGGATILVDKKQVDAARVKLASTDLSQRGLVGFEMFSKSDMGLTEFAQRINYQRALQGELTRTIIGFDGIESARVHLSLPEQAAFRADKIAPKASVEVALQGGALLTPDTIAGIQHLVASSVPDLTPQAVVVLDARGAMVSAAPALETLSPDVQQTRAIESYYAARVRRTLGSLIPGTPFNVQAEATIPDLQTPAALLSWSPQMRSFPLAVTLQMPFSSDAAFSARLQSAALTALGPTVKADSVLIEVAPLRPAQMSAPADATANAIDDATRIEAPARTPESSRTSRTDAPAFTLAAPPLVATLKRYALGIAITVFALLATLAVALIARQLLRPRRLNAAQQDHMALQFKSMMPEEKSHAA